MAFQSVSPVLRVTKIKEAKSDYFLPGTLSSTNWAGVPGNDLLNHYSHTFKILIAAYTSSLASSLWGKKEHLCMSPFLSLYCTSSSCCLSTLSFSFPLFCLNCCLVCLLQQSHYHSIFTTIFAKCCYLRKVSSTPNFDIKIPFMHFQLSQASRLSGSIRGYNEWWFDYTGIIYRSRCTRIVVVLNNANGCILICLVFQMFICIRI